MQHFLTPMLALIVWTFVMMMIMYWRRIPAMTKISKNTQEFIDNPKLYEKMPKSATYAADNYNHLHEQPAVFYALMLYVFAMGQVDSFYLSLAWIYVAIRIVHSLVQVTSNSVNLRFGLFVLASLSLIVMALRAAAQLF